AFGWNRSASGHPRHHAGLQPDVGTARVEDLVLFRLGKGARPGVHGRAQWQASRAAHPRRKEQHLSLLVDGRKTHSLFLESRWRERAVYDEGRRFGREESERSPRFFRALVTG